MNYNKRENIQFVKIYEDAQLPEYAHEKDSGMDLPAYPDNGQKYDNLKPGESKLVSTGLKVAHIPSGYEAQIRPRSGLAANHGISVLNTPGTIDNHFRGELKVILINHSNMNFQFNKGDRIAQLVISPVVQFRPIAVSEDDVEQTDRGEKGYGSTGV